MRGGDYRHSITIEQPTEVKDANGVLITTWSTYKTFRAKIVPLNGQEYFTAKQVAASVTTRFRMRYSIAAAAITNKMRINWNSTYFDIESIITPQELNREVILMAVQKNA